MSRFGLNNEYITIQLVDSYKMKQKIAKGGKIDRKTENDFVNNLE